MQDENKTNISSLLNLDVLVSFVIIIGTMYYFRGRILGHFAASVDTGIDRYSYVQLGVVLLSLLILFVNSMTSKNALFIWLAVFYVLIAFVSTALGGRYTVQRLPFRFIELFYWVAVMLLAYYAVLTLNTIKFHVAIVALALPYLSYCFYFVQSSEVTSQDFLLLNPVYFISFLMPVVLLLRSKIFKVGLLLLIFVVIVLSYKRMAIIAYVMSVMVYFYFLSRSGSGSKFWKNAAIVIGALLFIGMLAYVFRYMAGALGLDWGGRLGSLAESGGSGRIDIWRRALSATKSQPSYWLLGHGYGALGEDVRWGHNDVIEILYDFGLMGLALYVMFIGKMVHIFFEMKKFGYKHLGAFAVSLVWWFWGAMTDVYINYPYWSLAIALSWGLMIGDFENTKQRAYLLETDDVWDMDPDYEEGSADMPYAYDE